MAKISILRGYGGVEPKHRAKLSPSHDHFEERLIAPVAQTMAITDS
jgi:hypothetical protein